MCNLKVFDRIQITIRHRTPERDMVKNESSIHCIIFNERQNVKHFYQFNTFNFHAPNPHSLACFGIVEMDSHHRNFPQHWTLKLLLEIHSDRPSSKRIWSDKCVAFAIRILFVRRCAADWWWVNVDRSVHTSLCRFFFFSFIRLYFILGLMGTCVRGKLIELIEFHNERIRKDRFKLWNVKSILCSHFARAAPKMFNFDVLKSKCSALILFTKVQVQLRFSYIFETSIFPPPFIAPLIRVSRDVTKKQTRNHFMQFAHRRTGRMKLNGSNVNKSLKFFRSPSLVVRRCSRQPTYPKLFDVQNMGKYSM